MNPEDPGAHVVYETEVVAETTRLVPTSEGLLRQVSQDPRPPRVVASEELSAWRRVSPMRSRWPELVTLDDRVSELEQRAAALNEELAHLAGDRLNVAREADTDTLADWLAGGEKGTRPEPTVPAIEAEIKEKTADRDALLVARDRVLEQKEQFVQKNRDRLVRESDRATEEAHKRFLGLIAALEEARGELAECRASSLWAALYPGDLASSMPPAQLLAGGLRKPVEIALGIATQIQAQGVFAALRADADFLRTAMTRDQATAIGAAGDAPGQAMWAGTPEQEEQVRRENREARERYRQQWGVDPP